MSKKQVKAFSMDLVGGLIDIITITSEEIDSEKMTGAWVCPEAIPVAFQGIDSLISLLKGEDMLDVRLPLFFEDSDRVRKWIQSTSTAQPLLILIFEALAQPEIKAPARRPRPPYPLPWMM